jgi:hypothetical protein
LFIKTQAHEDYYELAKILLKEGKIKEAWMALIWLNDYKRDPV